VFVCVQCGLLECFVDVKDGALELLQEYNGLDSPSVSPPPHSWPFSGFYKARECLAVVTAGLVMACSEGQ